MYKRYHLMALKKSSNRHAGLEEPVPHCDAGAPKNILKLLDSGFRRNYGKRGNLTFYEFMPASAPINFRRVNSFFSQLLPVAYAGLLRPV